MKKEAVGSLFGDGEEMTTVKIDIENLSEFDGKRILELEKETVGFYVSGHPLDEHKEKIEQGKQTIRHAKKAYKGMTIIVAGILSEIKPFTTKKGDKMAFIKLSDYTDSIEAVAFPRTYSKYKDILRQENCVAFKGKINERNGEKSFVIDKIKELKKPIE
jgi:DNA polymerase-3 subunit alpha